MGLRAKRKGNRPRSAFTLLELLIVLAIGIIVASLTVRAFSGILAGGFTQVVSDMSETLEQARAYAMSNNTYVYVGFDEVDASSTATPPPAGNGLVVVAIVASKDGTDGFNGTTTWSPNDSTGKFNLVAISKLMKFPNVHLPKGSTLPTTGNMVRPTPSDPANDYLDLTANPTSANSGFGWPLAAAGAGATYNFSNLIRFGPQGDATILALPSAPTKAPVVDYMEIGLEPTHGNNVPAKLPANVAAIQIDGSTGLVKSYRP